MSSLVISASCFVAMAIYGVAMHALWLWGGALDGLARPALAGCCGAVGFALVHRVSRRRAPVLGPAAPRSLQIAFALLALAVFVPLFWGCVELPAREWDGYAMWELRARQLAGAGGLTRPFFVEAGVYAPSRGYPLLQPLLVADASRLVGYPASRVLYLFFFALHLCCVHALLATRLSRGGALLGSIFVMLTPAWIGPGSASVDSGYGELLLSTAILGICAGFPVRDERDPPALSWLAAACFVVLPMIKPEGSVYGVLALLVGLRSISARPFVAFALALSLGSVLASTLGARLLFVEAAWTDRGLSLGLDLLPLVLLLVRLALGSFAARPPAWIWLGAIPLVRLAFLALEPQGLGGPLAVVFDGGLARAYARLADLPGLVAGIVGVFLNLRSFALLWPLLACVLVFQRWRVSVADRKLLLFVAAGLAACTVALLMVPEADLEHELRSRYGRLVLHWCGPAWIVVLGACVTAPGSAQVRRGLA